MVGKLSSFFDSSTDVTHRMLARKCRAHLISIVFSVSCFFIVVFGSGCTTQKLYEGPLRPLEEIAVIIADASSCDTLLQKSDYIDASVFKGNKEASQARILSVDNNNVYGKRILVLPGVHSLFFSYSVVVGYENNMIKSRQTSRSIPFMAEAGKTYYVFADVKWNSDHTDAPHAEFTVKSLPYIEAW